MKDPKYLPNCVLIMDRIIETLKSIYTDAGRGRDASKVTLLIFICFLFCFKASIFYLIYSRA